MAAGASSTGTGNGGGGATGFGAAGGADIRAVIAAPFASNIVRATGIAPNRGVGATNAGFGPLPAGAGAAAVGVGATRPPGLFPR